MHQNAHPDYLSQLPIPLCQDVHIRIAEPDSSMSSIHELKKLGLHQFHVAATMARAFYRE